MKIGILSDTHDLLRPQVMASLSDVQAILHAGDISSQRILDQLVEIAPVYAVRGNADKEWAADLPAFREMELAGLHICMTHRKKDLPADLSPYDLAIVGHSHRYAETWQTMSTGKRTLIFNPGSCGPRRFHQPITLAVMTVRDDGWAIRRVEIPHLTAVQTIDPGDLRKQIEITVREAKKGRGPLEIAGKYGLDPALTEQIIRLQVTHPGVSVEGIMSKMGL
ncbi:MAG: metallophosphoesterase family protein [Clostridia bacterium]|nr:metallophosphoesterase family protein [Clostridia bacterium]